MQKASQGPNWTENADNADEAEIVQVAYNLLFTFEFKEIGKCMAERVGLGPTGPFLNSSSSHTPTTCSNVI
jgi:hypothetical protein